MRNLDRPIQMPRSSIDVSGAGLGLRYLYEL